MTLTLSQNGSTPHFNRRCIRLKENYREGGRDRDTESTCRKEGTSIHWFTFSPYGHNGQNLQLPSHAQQGAGSARAVGTLMASILNASITCTGLSSYATTLAPILHYELLHRQKNHENFPLFEGNQATHLRTIMMRERERTSNTGNSCHPAFLGIPLWEPSTSFYPHGDVHE